MEARVNSLLNQLRDLHSPVAPGWWPPAPGWWLLLALLVVAAVVLWQRRRQVQQRRAPLLAALRELEQIAAAAGSSAQRLQAVAILLRQLAMLRRLDAAALPAEQLPQLLFGASQEAQALTASLSAALVDRFAPELTAAAGHPGDTAITSLHALLQLRLKSVSSVRASAT